MLESQRTTSRAVATRRTREVDVYGGPSDASDAGQSNLFEIIWRRRWSVVVLTVLSLGLGVAYYLYATRIYSSTSIVYVQDNALKIVNDPMGGGSRSQAYLFTQCQLIASTAIISSALEKPGISQLTTLKATDNPVGMIKRSLTVLPDKQSDLINVTLESTSANDAAALVNAIVEAYTDYQTKQHKSTAVEILKIFKKEADQHEANLLKTQQAMLELKKQNPDLSFNSDRGSYLVKQLADYSDRLTQAQLRALDLRTAVAEAEAVKSDPTALKQLFDQFQVGSDVGGLDPRLLDTYRQTRGRLTDLLDQLGTKHELVRLAEKQVERMQTDLKQATTDAAASYTALLQQSLRVAEGRVQEIQNILKQARESAVALNFKQAEFEQMKKDEDRITRSLDLLDSRMKEINVNEDVGSLTVSVLETAKAPFLPVRPVTSKVLAIALAAGLMVGVGLAMLRDLMDQRLRSADEISSLLELPILGAIPRMLTKGQMRERGKVVQAQPKSVVSEAYRSVRTAVSFGAGDGTVIKTLLVTSPAPGEGKSTCASNLALAFGQSGRRTLLIDADCRRPMQNNTFHVEGGRGLSDVLGGTCDFADAVQRNVAENLDLLPCGTIPHNPAELLDSQALLNLLGQVSAEYDQVLLDSPPLIPVTDARIIAASCDATILVLRAERSTRPFAEHARDSLMSVGASILGVVVNDVPRGKGGYGYDYYYGAGHYGSNTASAGRLPGNGRKAGNGAMVVSSSASNS